jgi:hypothetical protein
MQGRPKIKIGNGQKYLERILRMIASKVLKKYYSVEGQFQKVSCLASENGIAKNGKVHSETILRLRRGIKKRHEIFYKSIQGNNIKVKKRNKVEFH